MTTYDSIKTASLVLYTAQANTKLVSNTILTWKNINLRKICGDVMYEKYNTFNLVLHTISTQATSAAFNTQAQTSLQIDDRNILINMSGLAWENNSYSFLDGCDTISSILGNYQITVSTGTQGPPTTQTYSNININTFGKSAASTDITIFYTRIVPNATTNSYAVAGNVNGITTAWPEMVFIFDIVGCELASVGRDRLLMQERPLFR